MTRYRNDIISVHTEAKETKATKTKIMSVKRIKNSNATQIYTNKYIEHVSNKPTITSMREKGADKYENSHKQAVTLELSRRDREPSILRTF